MRILHYLLSSQPRLNVPISKFSKSWEWQRIWASRTEPGESSYHIPDQHVAVTHHLDVHRMVALAVPVDMLLVAGWKESDMGAIDSTHYVGDGCHTVESTFNLIPLLTRWWHVDIGGCNHTESLQHSSEDSGKGCLRHANNILGHHLVGSLAKVMEHGEQLCHARYSMFLVLVFCTSHSLTYSIKISSLVSQNFQRASPSVRLPRRVLSAKCHGAIMTTLLLFLRHLLNRLNCNKLHSKTLIAGNAANPTLSVSPKQEIGCR